jgi:hypothetical protein
MLVIETKEERGLAYLDKGHPSHLKTTEFAQKSGVTQSVLLSVRSRHMPYTDADRQI